MDPKRAAELANRACAIARLAATLLVRDADTENLILLVEQSKLRDALLLSFLTEDWKT